MSSDWESSLSSSASPRREEGREDVTQTSHRPSVARQPAGVSRDIRRPRMDPGMPVSRMPTQMFGDNNVISGGNFYQAQNMNHICSARGIDPFMRLLEHVSSSAFHNSAERYDPPRCHPNTRVEVLEKIRDWAIQYAFDRKSWILWLNGAAGAGKSAIMQSIAELLLLQYSFVAVASFFFSRGDSKRNTIAPLVSTLAYQLIQQIPATSDLVLLTIAHDPLIFEQSLEFQLQQLIIQPLINLPFHMQKLFIVFIDGLDECLNRDHQTNLIKVAGNICIGKDIPIVFIIASRRESQIQFEFNQETVSHILEIIPLDDSEASDDIRRFLNAKFADIKKTHPFQHLLTPDWPTISTVTDIVEKASNQFIYASTVVKYISSPRANPAHRLKIVQDLRLLNPSSEHPFAHLDSLYRHIFSQVENLDQVLDILAFHILTQEEFYTHSIENMFLLEPGDLQVLLLDLSPVIQFKPHNGRLEFSFLHASLPDFLQDSVRSKQYFLDLEKYHTKLLCMFLGQSFSKIHSQNNLELIAKREDWRLCAVSRLLQESPTPSSQLQHAFVKFDSTLHQNWLDKAYASDSLSILDSLENLDFGDQSQAYQHVLHVVAEGHARFWTLHDDDTKEEVRNYPDLCVQICQLRPELARRPSLDLSQDWWPLRSRKESLSYDNSRLDQSS